MSSDVNRRTPVTDVMGKTTLATARPSTEVQDIAKQMKGHRTSSVVILDNVDNVPNKPVGIVTERDITRKVVAEGKIRKKIRASDLMSQPLIAAGPEVSLYDAAQIMSRYEVRKLPIVRNNEVLGIVTATDLAKWIYERNNQDPVLAAMARFQYIEKA